MQGPGADVERSTIMYDPSEPRLTVESGGNAVEMNFVQAPAKFLIQDEDGNIRHALWLTEDEASVLDKMVSYILDKVRVTEQSRTTLESLRPRIHHLAVAQE